MLSLQDVTKEGQLNNSAFNGGELFFRSLLEKLPAGAYTCERDGLITFFNQHAIEIWGREPKLYDPADRYCGSFKLYSIDGTPINHDQCWMALALKNNKEYNGKEIIIERPDGLRVTALAHANPFYDETGKLLGAVNVIVDISEQKKTENALKAADRSKNEFLAVLAHELRNPLAPIRNALQILKFQEAASAESGLAMDIIERQLKQMTLIIDDLLDIARITGNKLKLRKVRTELKDLVQTSIEISRSIIQEREHQFDVNLPSENIMLNCDPTRISQVISNLLNNAAKYTERGGKLLLNAERRENEVVITVKDNGIGIPLEMLPFIFDMFTQVDNKVDKSQSGLGVGLTLAKRLVEMHGGSITSFSEGLGKGSEFTIRLPIANEQSQTKNEVSESPQKSANGLRILIVDDNCDSADSLGLMLKMMKYDIRIANDGFEALKIGEAFKPGVVLMDIGLPTMSGYDVARKMRELDWGKNIILAAVTGWGQDEDKRLSKEAGFDFHLVKPIDPTYLLQILEKVIQ